MQKHLTKMAYGVKILVLMGKAIQNSKIMTRGNLWKQILLFSLPLMLSQVLQVLFNMADVAVIGRCSGALSLASVGSTTILVSLFTGFVIGMGSGVNVVVAKYLGARRDSDVHDSVNASLIICAVLGVVIMALCLIFGKALLVLLNTVDELIDGAVLYFSIYALGMPALAIFNFGNGVLSANGDTVRPLIYLVIAGVLNVILNFFFVLGLGMDVDGVAWASVISQVISAVLVVVRLSHQHDSTHLTLRGIKLNMERGKEIIALGLPAGIQFAIFAIANLFIQSGINSLGTVAVAGNTAASNADTLVYNILGAIYTACATFMGQNVGAGNWERVERSYVISLVYSFTIGAVLGVLLILFGRYFLLLFTQDSSVIEAGMSKLNIMGFSFCVSAFMDCTISASRGIGKSLVPTIIVVMGSCVFRVIWVYTIFAHFRTIESLYLLYIFSWTITAVAEMIYYLHEYKKTKREAIACSNTI